MRFWFLNISVRKTVLPMLKALVSTPQRKLGTSAVVVGLLYAVRWQSRRSGQVAGVRVQYKKKDDTRGNVDALFFKRIGRLLKVAVPSWKSREALELASLTCLLVVRTYLSIALASVNGNIVKTIVSRDFPQFLKRLLILGLYAIPASTVNSALDYLSQKLALDFRQKLSIHLNKKYLNGLIYYQMTNLDGRITNPDQRFTQDLDKWASCLSNLYSNITKPVLDIWLFSQKLSELLGYEGPLVIIGWYFLSGLVIRFISPSFGKLTVLDQHNEGLYRSQHSSIVTHSEEISFYRGENWEKQRVEERLERMTAHKQDVLVKRFWMGSFDSMLVKYGAVMVAYAVLGLPVFGPNKERYLAKVGNDPSVITHDYIRNSGLLINLAKAIGRLVVSYKDMQNLAGFTARVEELDVVLDDLQAGKYVRTSVQGAVSRGSARGEIIETEDTIIFEDVPIITPNGDVLVERLNFKISQGMHVFIQGPNGCGKSSLFRILGELWPLFGGKLYKPKMDQLFYIPQRPYLPSGSLRDQIIYPHTPETMAARNVKDADLMEMLELVELNELVNKRGGLDSVEDWSDSLSGGQKQRVAMCRLLYHKPKFAILDECTSSMSLDAEAAIYQHYKNVGITLFTVSHRTSLLQFHNHLLKFDGNGAWSFSRLLEQ